MREVDHCYDFRILWTLGVTPVTFRFEDDAAVDVDYVDYH